MQYYEAVAAVHRSLYSYSMLRRVKCFSHNLLFYNLSQNFNDFVPLFKVVMLVSQLTGSVMCRSQAGRRRKAFLSVSDKDCEAGISLGKIRIDTQRGSEVENQPSGLRTSCNFSKAWVDNEDNFAFFFFFLDPKNLIAKKH